MNSSLVERGRSLMDPQLHPFLHFLVRMKPTSTNVFLKVTKNVKVTMRKILAVRRMFKYFPAKSLKLIPHQIGSMAAGLSCKRLIPSESIQGVLTLWRVATPSVTKKRTTPLCSFLLASISNTGRKNLHHVHLLNNKETTVWTCACLLPYRLQYRYVTKVLPAFVRNVFCGGYSVFVSLPLILNVVIEI